MKTFKLPFLENLVASDACRSACLGSLNGRNIAALSGCGSGTTGFASPDQSILGALRSLSESPLWRSFASCVP